MTDTPTETATPSFRSDVTVELVKHSAGDSDVLWAARVSTAGEQSLEELKRTRALQGTHQLPDARPPRQPLRAQLHDLLHQRPDLRLPRVPPPPRRLVVQRGIAAATGSSSRSSTSRARSASWSRRAARASTSSSRARRSSTSSWRGHGGLVPPVVRGLPGDAAAGVAREVARAVLPVGLFSSMYATCNARSLMHFLACGPSTSGRGPVVPAARDRDGRREDGGAWAEADAAHPRGLQRQRPRRPVGHRCTASPTKCPYCGI